MSNNPINPYQAPQGGPPPQLQHGDGGRAGPNGEWVACPQCRSTDVSQPSFTWWGGVLGPKMLTHIVCNQCSTSYNGKSGESNNGKIAVYIAVATIVSLGLVVAIMSM